MNRFAIYHQTGSALCLGRGFIKNQIDQCGYFDKALDVYQMNGLGDHNLLCGRTYLASQKLRKRHRCAGRDPPPGRNVQMHPLPVECPLSLTLDLQRSPPPRNKNDRRILKQLTNRPQMAILRMHPNTHKTFGRHLDQAP